MRSRLFQFVAGSLFALLLTSLAPAGIETEKYFAIEVVDEETGRGVPLVELTTVHGIRYVTDSAGRVAFYEPGLMNEEIFFAIEAHGYERQKDGFGYAGVRAKTTPGETRRVEVRRTNLAERLYRLSGAGIYRDTVLLGLSTPTATPLLNAKVVGQDSVLATTYKGKIHWFWGDTSHPGYPLRGNFNASGATSPLPGPNGTEPSRAIEYSYFHDETGFAKKMAPIPGEGPTWLAGVAIVADKEGTDRMVAGYAKIRNQLETYARGIVVFDDEREEFVPVTEIPLEEPLVPTGHALPVREDGGDFLYFSGSLPLVRVLATLDAVSDVGRYETFTPLRAGSRWEDRDLERDEAGRLVYGWKKNTAPVGPGEQATLQKEGLLTVEESLFALRDIVTGAPISLHSGAVEWNPFRNRWILIASEIFGTSVLGEVWFAEADSPLGPWVYARKIISHDDYTFYNPKHHRFLDEENGRIIYLDGTYTKLFSGAQEATPRYDYNQILYRLDLANPELALPVAIYREDDGGQRCLASARHGAKGGKRPEFWALEEARGDSVAVQCGRTETRECGLVTGNEGDGDALFYALPPGHADLPPGTIPLENRDGDVICFVWEHPMPEGPVLPIRRE